MRALFLRTWSRLITRHGRFERRGSSFVVLVRILIQGVALGPALAWANAFLDEFARPLPADRVFYRWQSTTSGENLAKLGTLNAATNAHFMNMKDSVTAGAGVYFAGSELSSSEYLPATGGNLLEVRIPKGTMILDLNDPATLKALRLADVDLEALYAGAHASDGFVIKYTADWYVAKNMTDRMHFRMYPGLEQSAASVVAALNEAGKHAPHVAGQLNRQVGDQRPDFIRTHFKPETLAPALLRTMPAPELVQTLKTQLATTPPPDAARNLFGFLAGDLNALDVIHRGDRAVFDRVAETILVPRLTPLSLLSENQTSVVRALAVTAGADKGAARARSLELIRRALNDPDLTANPTSLEKFVTPLIANARLNDQDRAMITDRLRALTERPKYVAQEAEALRRVAEVAGVRDPVLDDHLSLIEHHFAAISRAEDTRSVKDVVAALRDHPSDATFERVRQRLTARVPDDVIKSALDALRTNHAGRSRHVPVDCLARVTDAAL